ncbi:DNA cytosine methyltransferase [Aerococcaceae bacterium NML171108]|nr:DNA cytosine methyltransferase [Aerococcaceae bacterium NML171108]
MNILDVFSGAGGLTEGFRSNDKFNFVCHIEMDRDACASLELRDIYYYLKINDNLSPYVEYINGNISKEQLLAFIPEYVTQGIVNEEISRETLPFIFEFIDQRLGTDELDGIIGGPPCQAYSTIGRVGNKSKKSTDKRIYLYKHYLDFLNKYNPKFFVFENVKGLLSFKDIFGDLLLPKIIKEFDTAGYSVDYRVVDASEFGVPQKRERLFIIGYRKDLVFNKSFFNYLDGHIELPPKLKDLFEDLPRIKSGKRSDKYYCEPTNDFVRKYIRAKDDFLTQHAARPHNENDLKIYKHVVKAKNKGKNLKYDDIPKQLQTHSNTSSFLDRYKALNYDSVSHTVVAHISKDGHYYIHPDLKQNRSITVREAARIQGFPDNFYFEHSRTAAFKQIGNAVPPILSQKIALSILDFIEQK